MKRSTAQTLNGGQNKKTFCPPYMAKDSELKLKEINKTLREEFILQINDIVKKNPNESFYVHKDESPGCSEFIESLKNMNDKAYNQFNNGFPFRLELFIDGKISIAITVCNNIESIPIFDTDIAMIIVSGDKE